MPAMACYLDAEIAAPGYAFSPGDCSLPLRVPFSAISLPVETNPEWSPSQSVALYRINQWGVPYFSVNSLGHIAVRPHGTDTAAHQEIDLLQVVKKVSNPESIGGLGLQLPLLLRFPHILKNRLECLQSSFDFAIRSQKYDAHYQGVYPVKCNQERFLVEDVVEFGFPFRFGLEAGSKPELLLAMNCLCKGNPEALLICNGFKDGEFIFLALLARKLLLNAVIVIEQEEELPLVIEFSKKLSVKPVIGVRAKLRTAHSGHFGSTSGANGKFGLTISQILSVVKQLERAGMLDCFHLLHFHIGSQIPSTAMLADGIAEAAQIYCELTRLGARMQIIDIGGGLGIDYDGSRSGDSDLSVAYGLEEYALAVVQALKNICDRKNVKHPIICSESGRAIVSHHSVLIFEAFSASHSSIDASMNQFELQNLIHGLVGEGRADYYNLTADKMKQRCFDLFKEGSISIEQLAAVDELCDRARHPAENGELARTYHINLSVFTSMPDSWGIGQQFPILPIHKLDQNPRVRGVLCDLTCDSDGKIDKFIGGRNNLPLHQVDGNGGRYYLGMFLGGAYEEALGGIHNLLGGPSLVRVLQADRPHGFLVKHAISGPSCGDVLRLMQHEPALMFDTLKLRMEEVSRCDGGDNVRLMDALARSFNAMPYLRSSCLLLDVNNGGCHFLDESDDHDPAISSEKLREIM